SIHERCAPSSCCAPSASPSNPLCRSRRPTAASTSCGSIQTDCIAAVAPAYCPTDILFSFASASQVWVTSFLRKKGRSDGPGSSFRSCFGGPIAGRRTRPVCQPGGGRRGGHPCVGERRQGQAARQRRR